MADNHMTKQPCGICGGSRIVRLGVRKPMPAAAMTVEEHFGDAPQLRTETRTYPCPECAPKVDEARIMTVGAVEYIDERSVETYRNEPGFRRYVGAQLARRIAMELVEGGKIALEEVDSPARLTVYGTLGVVDASHVASIEERLRSRQHLVAQRVAEEIKREIGNWGSRMGQQIIAKREAYRLIADVLRDLQQNPAKYSHPEPSFE